MRKDCYLAQRVGEAESALACFSARKGRVPTSWEELASDPECGAFGIPKDWQGRQLVMKNVRGTVVVTDTEGSRGGSWLVCGPGFLGFVTLLLVFLGAVATIAGLIKRMRVVALLGVVLIVVGCILNYTGQMD